MPQIIDATVINQAYSTEGNGGRKLVKLENGWLVAVVRSATQYFVYRSTNNGNNWELIYTSTAVASFQGLSVACRGFDVYVSTSFNGNSFGVRLINALNGESTHAFTHDASTQSAIGDCSLAINEAGTELHATWASRNPTYPNSFNIRYAKGVINPTTGVPTWGSVEQVTILNSNNSYFTEPSIFVRGDNPYIVLRIDDIPNNRRSIGIISKAIAERTIIPNMTLVKSDWGGVVIHNGITHTQANPSPIYVPPHISGTPNGRIWVAWQGRDVTDTTVDNIRASFSDDGGVTWSSMQKLTSGNLHVQRNPTLTVNKDNKVFLVFQGAVANSYNGMFQVRVITYENSEWSTITEITTNSNTPNHNPSTVVDNNLNFTTPLLVYQTNSKVGFYGTWQTFTPMPVITLPTTNTLAKANIDFIRGKVNEFRTSNGLQPRAWTDPIIIPNVTPIKAIHWNEIKEGIDEVYTTNQQTFNNDRTRSIIKERLVSKSSRFDLDNRVGDILKALRNE